MSNFTARIKHPETGEPVYANFLDNYFGPRKFGVVIIGSNDNDPVYKAEDIVRLPDEEVEEEAENEETDALPNLGPGLPDGVSIETITTSTTGRVYGLGTDSFVYLWNDICQAWRKTNGNQP